MRAYNVSGSTNHSIYAHLPFETAKHMTDEKGLLDSGATHNFIDVRTVIRQGVETQKMKTPRTVTNVDGTTNRAGTISKYTNLTCTYNEKQTNLPFYVTNLGKDRIIFGMPWFQTFEPTVSWKKKTLEGKITIQTESKATEVNATTMATSWAIKNSKGTNPSKEKDFPEQYTKYRNIFSEESAKRFPPSREEDHAIKFVENVPRFFDIKVYQMSHKQVTFLRKWIDEELNKGFIRPSKSPYPSPTFLIEKKNADYQVVQDYRTLNKNTVLDKHPLPLISNLIDQLSGKSLFTKFDIRMGYNNIRIKEGDQEKAAFTTPLGQYEPMVMNFGLRNAPATFVRAMIKIFRTLQNRYPSELLVYMDDILIATKDDLDRHSQIVREVLAVMEQESYFLRLAKCEFEKRRTKYLGLILDHDTIKPDPNKING